MHFYLPRTQNTSTIVSWWINFQLDGIRMVYRIHNDRSTYIFHRLTLDFNALIKLRNNSLWYANPGCNEQHDLSKIITFK